MRSWVGAAGVCVNEAGQMLMVLQGKPEEKKRWSVPSGGAEIEETLEQCCMRELYEETGYEVAVLDKMFEKTGKYGDIHYSVTYFEIRITGGTAVIHDPDQLIYEIAWKNADEIASLDLSFPEDRNFLLSCIKNMKGQ